MVSDAVKRWTYDEIAAQLEAARFGFTEVLPMDRVLDATQARHPGKLAHVDFQNMPFELPELPYEGATTGTVGAPPPLLGEHSREILADLGFSDAERFTLMASGWVVEPIPGSHFWAPVRPAKSDTAAV